MVLDVIGVLAEQEVEEFALLVDQCHATAPEGSLAVGGLASCTCCASAAPLRVIGTVSEQQPQLGAGWVSTPRFLDMAQQLRPLAVLPEDISVNTRLQIAAQIPVNLAAVSLSPSYDLCGYQMHMVHRHTRRQETIKLKY